MEGSQQLLTNSHPRRVIRVWIKTSKGICNSEMELIWTAQKQKQLQIVSNIHQSHQCNQQQKYPNLHNNILKLTVGTLELTACKKLLCILEHWQRDGVFNYPKDNDDSGLPNALQGRRTSSPFHNTTI